MAEQILAEIGTNIKKQFPSAAHLCSWAGLGEDYFDKQKQHSIVKYSVRRLENLGYSVTISEVS